VEDRDFGEDIDFEEDIDLGEAYMCLCAVKVRLEVHMAAEEDNLDLGILVEEHRFENAVNYLMDYCRFLLQSLEENLIENHHY
jgi:hypothetical protein